MLAIDARRSKAVSNGLAGDRQFRGPSVGRTRADLPVSAASVRSIVAARSSWVGRCIAGHSHPIQRRCSLTGVALRLPPPLPAFLRFTPRPGRPELPVSLPSGPPPPPAPAPPAPSSSSSSSSSSSWSTSSSDSGAEGATARRAFRGALQLVSRTWLATSGSPARIGSSSALRPMPWVCCSTTGRAPASAGPQGAPDRGVGAGKPRALTAAAARWPAGRRRQGQQAAAALTRQAGKGQQGALAASKYLAYDSFLHQLLMEVLGLCGRGEDVRLQVGEGGSSGASCRAVQRSLQSAQSSKRPAPSPRKLQSEGSHLCKPQGAQLLARVQARHCVRVHSNARPLRALAI